LILPKTLRVFSRGARIINFPDGIHEDLKIPDNKWIAEKIIIEGVEWERYAQEEQKYFSFRIDDNGGAIVSGIYSEYVSSNRQFNESTLTYDYIYSVIDNEEEITELVIPAEMKREEDGVEVSYPVTSVGAEAFGGFANLESIDLPETITNIGDYAFYQCSNLTINFPNGKHADLVIPEDNWGAKEITGIN